MRGVSLWQRRNFSSTQMMSYEQNTEFIKTRFFDFFKIWFYDEKSIPRHEKRVPGPARSLPDPEKPGKRAISSVTELIWPWSDPDQLTLCWDLFWLTFRAKLGGTSIQHRSKKGPQRPQRRSNVWKRLKKSTPPLVVPGGGARPRRKLFV